MSLKIELKQFPIIQKVSDIIGEPTLDAVAEVLRYHDELKLLVKQYNILVAQRQEAAEAADAYLKK